MTLSRPQQSRILRWAAAAWLLPLAARPVRAQAQLSPAEIDSLRRTVGNRVEAATILGGDFGFSGASFKVAKSDNLSLSKFGGGGDFGPRRPLGSSGVRWQPRLQGELGSLDAKTPAVLPEFAGAETQIHSVSIQFGGGARFWFNEHFNIAPTVMGMYGYTRSSYFPNGNALAGASVPQGRALGLIDYNAETWTVRPAAEFQLEYVWKRAIYTLTSLPVYYHTESFRASNPGVSVNGNSETWENKLDVDVPLGKKLWGRELRTGGYFSRKEIYGSLRDGLNGLDAINEVHGRLVLDYLGKIRWVKWIGLGGSYLWGRGLTGRSYGADVAFVF